MKLRDRFLKTKSDAKIKRFGETSCLFSECISIKVFFLENLRLKSLWMSNADSLVCSVHIESSWRVTSVWGGSRCPPPGPGNPVWGPAAGGLTGSPPCSQSHSCTIPLIRSLFPLWCLWPLIESHMCQLSGSTRYWHLPPHPLATDTYWPENLGDKSCFHQRHSLGTGDSFTLYTPQLHSAHLTSQSRIYINPPLAPW